MLKIEVLDYIEAELGKGVLSSFENNIFRAILEYEQYEGKLTLKEVAERYDLKVSAIMNWRRRIQNMFSEGKGFQERLEGNCKLTKMQNDFITEKLKDTPVECNSQGLIWTGRVLKNFISKEFNVDIGIGQCQRYIRDLCNYGNLDFNIEALYEKVVNSLKGKKSSIWYITTFLLYTEKREAKEGKLKVGFKRENVIIAYNNDENTTEVGFFCVKSNKDYKKYKEGIDGLIDKMRAKYKDIVFLLPSTKNNRSLMTDLDNEQKCHIRTIVIPKSVNKNVELDEIVKDVITEWKTTKEWEPLDYSINYREYIKNYIM